MAKGDKSYSMEAYPMNAGDGPYSYARNSFAQGSVVASVRDLVYQGIVEKLDVRKNTSPDVFRIADFGCSVGPNTFSAMQNIVDAIKSKYQNHGRDSHTVQFHVIFNDHESNDFNTLFRTLPPDRQYFAAGAPGSFHTQVLPNGYLHVGHSSTAIHWLSKVPGILLDKNSDAFNKGRIFYCNAPDSVINVFKTQFEEDMETFLCSRAQELVQGGLMALAIPARANDCSHSQCGIAITYEFMGSCIMDLVSQGLVDEEKANSFNLPIYFTSADEMVESVNKNGYFSIEEMKEVPQVRVSHLSCAQFYSGMRAAFETVIKTHFGESITEEIFKLYLKKLENPDRYGYSISEYEKSVNLFVLLKRR